MTYTPINWQNGDTITAEKLNKMDNGWGLQETQLFSETVTTAEAQDEPAPVGSLQYNSQINTESLTVEFDGETYTLPIVTLQYAIAYGEDGGSGPVFTTYPLFIVSLTNENVIYTETAGTHTITAFVPDVATSTGFNTAVMKASGGAIPLLCESGITTGQEMFDAILASRLMYFYHNNNCCFISVINFTSDTSGTVTFYPSAVTFTASITNGVFVVTNKY